MLRRLIWVSCFCGCVSVAAVGQDAGLAKEKTKVRNKNTTGEIAKQQAGSQRDAKHAVDVSDKLRTMQSTAMQEQSASWGHWGNQPDRFSTWTNHSNRLVPTYTFGFTLSSLRERGSQYTSPKYLKKLYGREPEGTVNPTAMYYDQTDIYTLQKAAFEAGYCNIILMVFDGMDWQTTRAAAIYKSGKASYESGRGSGLSFQDFRALPTDFGLFCTSPWSSGAKYDVDSQTVINANHPSTGGYDPTRGGDAPWNEQSGSDYLLGLAREMPHSVTDSSSAATSMCSGIKTFNGAINYAPDGTQVTPLARELQSDQEYRVGLVSNVPISHATPAAAYANNVTRTDYQDISRDLLGLPSISHRDEPLLGVDVLLGGGWGEMQDEDKLQGANYKPGNPYMHADDMRRSDVENGGRYVVVERSTGKNGKETLMAATSRAVDGDHRLLGLFGTKGGHLPFQTADGNYNPTLDITGTERYSEADLHENPTLADLTSAALLVLERSINGFWLMIEAGDVDWANHSNNIDNSIGAVLSGEAAFDVVTDWIDRNNAWRLTAVIITADHGHYLVIDDPERFAEAGSKD